MFHLKFNLLKIKPTLAITTGAALLASNLAWSQFTITDKDYGDFESQSAAFDQLFVALETSINSQPALSNLNPDTYLKAMANATVTAGGGLDADYSSSYSMVLVGAGVGFAADFAPNTGLSSFLSDRNPSALEGIGAQGGAMIGISGKKLFAGKKVGPLDLSKSKLFLSLFTFGVNQLGLNTSMTHFGLTGQYKLMDEKSLGFGLLKWGGLDLTAGLKYNKTRLTFTTDIEPVTADSTISGLGTVTTAFTGTATVGADVGIFTIPLEVSTYARVLYFMSFFGGLGADLSFGSAASVSTVEGPIEITSSLVNSGLPSAQASLDLGSSQSPSFMALRAFGGIQFDFYVGALTFQLNKSLNTGALGLSAGGKLFF